MLRYVGGGFLVGVPARDLTEAEVTATGWDRGALVGTGLYVDEAKAGRSRERVCEVEDREVRSKE